MEFREAYAGDTPLVEDILKAIGTPDEMIAPYRQSKQKALDLSKEALLEIRREALAQGLPDPTTPQAALAHTHQ